MIGPFFKDILKIELDGKFVWEKYNSEFSEPDKYRNLLNLEILVVHISSSIFNRCKNK